MLAQMLSHSWLCAVKPPHMSAFRPVASGRRASQLLVVRSALSEGRMQQRMRGVESCRQLRRHQSSLCAEVSDARPQIDKEWSAKAERPFDPYLTPKGEQQAKAVAAQLKKFDLKRVYVSPFLRLVPTRNSLLFQMEVTQSHTPGTEQIRPLAAVVATQRSREGESCERFGPKPAPD